MIPSREPVDCVSKSLNLLSDMVARVPGGRNQVEYPIENVAELCMTLSNKGHQALAAGCPDHHTVTAALLPQQVQGGRLKANQGEKDA